MFYSTTPKALLAVIVAAVVCASGCGGTSEASVAANAVKGQPGVKSASCSSWGQVNVAGAPADTFRCTATLESQAQVENAQGCLTPLCAPAKATRTLYVAVRDGKAYQVTP